jgi:hypothetical protein
MEPPPRLATQRANGSGHETTRFGEETMKKLLAGIAMLTAGLLSLTLSADGNQAADARPTVVVGTFDSRGLLFAYVGSAEFNQRMSALHAEREQAASAGDDERVAELDALGPQMQRRIHAQGFGTAPVDDIIARIEDRLPAIAKQAGVDVIVSKWTLSYSSPTAKFVDVTEQLAAEFNPDEATLEGMRELLATDPVPPDQLEHH